MPIRDFIVLLTGLIRRLTREVNRRNIADFAGSSSYFIFISIIPMLILLINLLPFTNLTKENLMTAISEFTPPMVAPFLDQLVTEAYDNSPGLISIAALVMIWTGSNGMMSLMRGFNAIWDFEERRTYLLQRAVAALYTIIILLAVIVMLMMGVFGNSIRSFLAQNVPALAPLMAVLQHLRFLVTFAIVTLFFACLYTFVPTIRQRFVYQLPGALFACLVWGIFSGFFTMYVSRINSYSIYGSLGTIIICLFWLYVGMYLLLMGAFINRFFKPAFSSFFPDKGYRHHKEAPHER